MQLVRAKRGAGIVGLLGALILLWSGFVGSARSQVAESIEAQFCVGGTPSVFEFTVVRRGLSVNTTHETIAIIADSLWTKVPGAGEGSSEYISVQYGFDADAGPLILRTNSGVTRFLDGGAPPDRWGSGSGIGDLSAVEVSAGIWDVTFSGAVGSSLDAFESGDMVRQTATAVFGVGFEIDLENTPITECAPPTTTTTTQATTTTTQVTTTTAAPTTTTVAPTSTVAPSSTLPATGAGDAVRISAPLGLGLLLAGLVALGSAAAFGSRRRSR